VVAAQSAAMTTTITAPSTPLAPALVDSQAAVVEIPDEDIPPPGWDQWVDLPAPAPDGGARGDR
jgi:hypothetical protein